MLKEDERERSGGVAASPRNEAARLNATGRCVCQFFCDAEDDADADGSCGGGEDIDDEDSGTDAAASGAKCLGDGGSTADALRSAVNVGPVWTLRCAR